MPHDTTLLIAGGTLYDGSGSPPRTADVLVRGDSIAHVGAPLSGAPADRCIDAADKIVCPGFIDAHSHSDVALLADPDASSKISQGVTTEIVGNCGASAAPLPSRVLPADWAELVAGIGPWATVADYRRLVDQACPAVNVALLAGHNTLRAGVMGYDARPAGPDESRRMHVLLEQALEEGARGISSGLIYRPGRFAPPDEIVDLARIVAARDGVYATHMRNENDTLLDALRETIDVGRAAGVRLQVSHLKVSGRPNWSRIDDALHTLHAALDEGVDLAADRYPYTCGYTDLDVILPPWAAEGSRDAMLERLRDPATSARIERELLDSRPLEDWAGIMIATTVHPDNERFRGMRLDAVAAALDANPVRAAIRLMETDTLRTAAFFFGMREENMWRILAEPMVMIGSDASARAPSGPLSRDYPHPRAYGAFPRFLRASLDGRTVPPGEAIRKMTSLPASRFRLSDRGLLAPGKKADLLVLDPAGLRDRASCEAPHQVSQGVEAVVVNGVLTFRGGRLTGVRAGRFL